MLDNAPSHPEKETLKSEDGNITCFFLPANSTAILQPMDQSVIESLKKRYRKRFIRSLVSEEGTSLKDFWKGYNLKHVIDNISDCWDEIREETLKRSWNKLWPGTEMASSDIASTTDLDTRDEFVNSTSTALNLNDEEINEWLRCDEADIGYQLLTDEEIIDAVMEANTDEENEDDGDDTIERIETEPVDLKEQAKEAASNISKFIEWYEQQEDAKCTETMLLRRFRAFAEKKSEVAVKQSLLTEFFKKTEEIKLTE